MLRYAKLAVDEHGSEEEAAAVLRVELKAPVALDDEALCPGRAVV